MKLLITKIFFFLILSGSTMSEYTYTFTTQTQTITNPSNVSAFISNSERLSGYVTGIKIEAQNQFPYVCEINVNKGSLATICTGALIGQNWLVASRKCVENATQILVDCANSVQGQRVSRFSSTQYWPKNAPGSYIALLKLDQPMPLNDYIKIIRLPKYQQLNDLFEDSNATSIGYYTAYNKYGSYQQYYDLKVTANGMCNTPHSFCSNWISGYSQYQNDNDSPVVIKEADGISTLIGIVLGNKQISTTYVQVSARLTSFLFWIQIVSGISRNTDRLHRYQCLKRNERLTSISGCYYAEYQSDGNLVVRHKSSAPLGFYTNTYNQASDQFCMLNNGVASIRNGLSAVWVTPVPSNVDGTDGMIVMQDDGNLALWAPDCRWVSSTYQPGYLSKCN